ncbi:hypothetical protein ACO0K9_04445 [Undibacterium sp. Ji50W]
MHRPCIGNLSAIFKALNVVNRMQAVRAAQEAGIVGSIARDGADANT